MSSPARLLQRNPHHERLIASLCTAAIVLGVCVRLLGVWLVPYGQTVRFHLEGLNDEPAHVRYIEHLAAHHGFPVQKHRFVGPLDFRRADFEYYQPPLFYLLGARVYAAWGPHAGLRAVRLLSALFGVATLLVVAAIFWKCGLERGAALPGLAFASLFLTHAYFCSLVSNDSLSWLLAALALLRIVSLAELDPSDLRLDRSLRRGALLGLILAAGLLTKSSVAVFLPLAAIAYAREAWRLKRARLALEGAGVLILACGLAAPWYARNLRLYGSLLALDMGFAPIPPSVPPGVRLRALVEGTINYFWFPMQHLRPSAWLKGMRVLGAAILAGHAIAAGARARVRALRGAHLYLALCGLAVAASYVRLNLSWSEPEARFLLPAFAPIVYGLVTGVLGTDGRTRWAVLGSCEILGAALFSYAFLVFM